MKKTTMHAGNEDHSPGRYPARLRFYADAFVLDTRSGLFFRLTPAAYLLLEAHVRGLPTWAFAGLLQRHYGIDQASAARDVELLLNQLASLGLLDEAAPEVTP